LTSVDEDSLLDKAKRYASIKYSLAIIEAIYLLAFLFILMASGLSRILATRISNLIPNHFLALAILVYILVVYILYYLLDFPLNLYRSFVLEHRFSLSNQKLGDWLKDQIKAGIIAYIIISILAEAFYYILRHYLHAWWLIISLFWIFFSLVLAKLVPVVIIPLFFKYRKLSDDTLRERIIDLADKMQVKILDVFEIDFSQKTKKANAAFVGWGRTKRVILADTLKDKYSFDEIEVILAHEFAHYRLKHLSKLILVNSSVIMFSFYIIFISSEHSLSIFGLRSLWDIAALPVILIYFVILGIIMQPFENYISRRLERNADLMALKVTSKKDAFISMMEKLASQNLSHRNPHPLIKFLFFDHPPVDERIAMAGAR